MLNGNCRQHLITCLTKLWCLVPVKVFTFGSVIKHTCLPLYSISVFNAGSCFSLCLKNACVALSPLLDSHLLSIWSFPQIISSICIFHLLILSSFTICFIFWWLLYRRLVSFFFGFKLQPILFLSFLCVTFILYCNLID